MKRHLCTWHQRHSAFAQGHKDKHVAAHRLALLVGIRKLYLCAHNDVHVMLPKVCTASTVAAMCLLGKEVTCVQQPSGGVWSVAQVWQLHAGVCQLPLEPRCL